MLQEGLQRLVRAKGVDSVLRLGDRLTITEAMLSMANALKRRICLLTMLMVADGAHMAAARPLTPFRYQAQAQRHCPADTVVWLDFRKGIYCAKRQKRYGQGSTGSFACLEEVRGNGYRRSVLGVR